jgi:chromosome segregation ATPase
MAAEHKAAFEKVEADLHQLQAEYQNLDRELDQKHEEVESLRSRSGGVDPDEMKELKREINDLEEEIKQYEVEKADMEDQIQSLQRDANHLIEKDAKIARERAEERKNLQNVQNQSGDGADYRISRNFRFSFARRSRRRRRLLNIMSERYILPLILI